MPANQAHDTESKQHRKVPNRQQSQEMAAKWWLLDQGNGPVSQDQAWFKW